jgi:predicted nuclease of predicted toxin-antitoxin system
MRLLIDSCLPRRLVPVLQIESHDARHVAEYGADPGDAAVWDLARRERRIVVTQDKDFGAMGALAADSVGVLRLKGIAGRNYAEAIMVSPRRHGAALDKGAVVTASPGRYRVRMPTTQT